MGNDLIPFADVERMAAVMGKNGLFGKKPDELLPLMLIAQAEGKHPAIAAMEYDIIQGRPAITARTAQARFQLSGGTIEWLERSDTVASARFTHPRGGTLVVTWDIERATRAKLIDKDNWKKYPCQMFSSRVVGEGVRAVFPACLSGLYTVEEVQDFDARPSGMKPAPEQHTGYARTVPGTTADVVIQSTITTTEPEPAPLVIGEKPRDAVADAKAECTRLADELGLDKLARKNAFAFAERDYGRLKADLEDRIRRRNEARQVAEAERAEDEGAEAAAEVML